MTPVSSVNEGTTHLAVDWTLLLSSVAVSLSDMTTFRVSSNDLGQDATVLMLSGCDMTAEARREEQSEEERRGGVAVSEEEGSLSEEEREGLVDGNDGGDWLEVMFRWWR